MYSNNHHLFHGETEHAWHRRFSSDFPALACDGAFAVLPVYSFRRIRADLPMDIEECLGGPVLADALQGREPMPPFLVLPPLRHTPRLDARQSLTLGLESCSGLVDEIVRSVVRAGIRRVIFLHLHPPLADWLDGTARDLRVVTGAAFYRIDLTAAGLDLETEASQDQIDSGTMLAPVSTRLGSLFDQIVRHDAARKGGRL